MQGVKFEVIVSVYLSEAR